MSKVKARVLAGFEHGDSVVPANVIVLADASLIESLKSGGVVDDHADAVAYGEGEGFKVVELEKGELSDQLQQRIEEKQAANTPAKLTAKQKTAAIAKLTENEKKAFEKTGGDIEAWLAKSDEDRANLVGEVVNSENDAKIINAFSDNEKTAFEKFGKPLSDWQALPEDQRNVLIDAEKNS